MTSPAKIEHTPWLDSGFGIDLPDGRSLLGSVLSEDADIRKQIVTAVNSHADLVKALEEIGKLSKPGQTINITQAIDILTDIWNAAESALSISTMGREELKVQS